MKYFITLLIMFSYISLIEYRFQQQTIQNKYIATCSLTINLCMVHGTSGCLDLPYTKQCIKDIF